MMVWRGIFAVLMLLVAVLSAQASGGGDGTMMSATAQVASR